MSGIRTRLSEQHGFGLITTILVIGILISLSLPLRRAGSIHHSDSSDEGSPAAGYDAAITFFREARFFAARGGAGSVVDSRRTTEVTNR